MHPQAQEAREEPACHTLILDVQPQSNGGVGATCLWDVLQQS